MEAVDVKFLVPLEVLVEIDHGPSLKTTRGHTLSVKLHFNAHPYSVYLPPFVVTL